MLEVTSKEHLESLQMENRSISRVYNVFSKALQSSSHCRVIVLLAAIIFHIRFTNIFVYTSVWFTEFVKVTIFLRVPAIQLRQFVLKRIWRQQ